MLNLQRHLVIIYSLIFGGAVTSSAQDFIILLPQDRQEVATDEETIITWSGRGKRHDYFISINNLFDDTIKTFLTRDTFMILTPDVASMENNLLIKIQTGKGGRSETVQITRLREPNPDTVVDIESFKQIILADLKQNRYAAAFSLFHRYKDTYDLSDYNTLFNTYNNWRIAGHSPYITIKKGKPVVVKDSRSGAVHRD
jgi:hypothetical protein